MPEARKKPCCICRHWFRPDPSSRGPATCLRQSGVPCSASAEDAQAGWRRRNPGYAIAYRIDQRAAQTETPAVLRVPAPLNQLPWEFAKDQFGVQGADFIRALGAVNTTFPISI